ncbi:MAG: metallophosphoesterase, partial [Candidatus Aminicenantes bacterium]|nr:metallophosphoesterase [Candidatus Aminicenantes bacterium]
MNKIKAFVSLFFLFCLPLLAQDLKFVVISDTNPDFWHQTDFSVFEIEIEQINRLKPDLVINLGDLIYGYGIRSTKGQWKRYLEVIKKFKVPYYQIPGNHDVFNKRAREIYLDIFKKTYLSFSVKRVHFILLDNLEDNKWGKIGQEQFQWLKQDLAKPDWSMAFVFVHVPVWDMKARNINMEWRQFWFEQIHPLLKAAKVKAVFAGHTHRFGPTRVYDGIRYYIAGGGGPKLHPLFVRRGGENFFLLVEIKGQDFCIKVVTRDKVLEEKEASLMDDLFGPYYYDPEKNKSRLK